MSAMTCGCIVISEKRMMAPGVNRLFAMALSNCEGVVIASLGNFTSTDSTREFEGSNLLPRSIKSTTTTACAETIKSFLVSTVPAARSLVITEFKVAAKSNRWSKDVSEAGVISVSTIEAVSACPFLTSLFVTNKVNASSNWLRRTI